MYGTGLEALKSGMAPELGQVVNLQPVSRKERLSQQHREDLEKMRLRARREKFCRYEEGGIEQPADSLGYIPEADRFTTDIAAAEKHERDHAIARQQQIQYNKRVNRAEAEEQRWRTLEIQHQMETQRMANMRDHGTAARSNKSSMPYNPISLRYDDGSDGDRLRYADESLRYRSALRADHLQQRMTSTGFNPITGEAYNKVPIPAAPTRPNC
ncbi:hypothetical protein AB1Y20_018382 [Prymnesium parvum]|uniref:Uncharacterized protein n=1 Tax=Prymnesium parvum TaxID=97485 RepID=A0AB34JRT3_PRYPA|mmetsp:Transcript_11564/g.25925  ORF Transcript_11564/g.25925 Transcript_11564/m.25925 type:complete len:213 (+) Transcript_11564:2-640(+)